jgi:hypothetical protein
MYNLAACDGSNCRGLHGGHDGRLTVERHDLDLEGLAVGVDMNHRADVANFKARVGHRCGQHDLIVFSNHAEGLLLAGISGHEPRSLAAPIDDPHRTDEPLAALFSVRRQPALDNIFLAMDRMGILNDVAVFREGSERGHEALWFVDREAEGLEDRALPLLSG